MSGAHSNIVPLTQETAKDFLPAKLRNKGSNIDLKALADKARTAIDGSEESLKAAGNIADGGWLTRLWHSGDFARSVVESIGYIRDISQINLALSAVCNDLAAANLTHAQKIDANHQATNEQLQDVQRSMAELLQHLRTQRDSALLQPIAQRLGQVDAADKEALQGWLHSFSETIDQQYQELQERIDQLAQAPTVAWGELDPIRQQLDRVSSANEEQQAHSARIGNELRRVEAELQNLATENARQMVLFGAEITHQKDVAAQRSQNLDASLRQSHAKLGAGLSQLNDLIAHTTRSLAAECKAREERDASLQAALAQSETALRNTIKALNLHWLKRFIWGGGALLLLQVLAFAFLASKIGG